MESWESYWRRRWSALTATATVALVVTIVSCGSSARLPDYAQRTSGGAVIVEVSDASSGSAHLQGGSGEILVKVGDRKARFHRLAVSGVGGIGVVSLDHPPLNMSPVLTPGDGVADFFAAVWADESGEELRVTLFLDVDWQQVVEGQLSVIAMERANSYLAGHVDFSEAIGGVYVRELSFRLEDNPDLYT